MEGFIVGDLVVVPFPFSDLSNLKKRPALVIKVLKKDIILGQVTHKSYEKSEEVPITNKDLREGNLKLDSYVRLTKIFTFDKSLISYKIGTLKHDKMVEIINKFQEIFKFSIA